jgi:hypothetical protein
MDWMCEPFITDKTGLSVVSTRSAPSQNYLDLRDRARSSRCCRAGSSTTTTCADLYAEAGVDLTPSPSSASGRSAAGRPPTRSALIMRALASDGLRLHGFGVKKEGIARYGRFLTSRRQMAWSYRARRDWPLPGCTHKSCANCSRYALRWRSELLAGRPDDAGAGRMNAFTRTEKP